jgi:hypothetical protein
MHGGDVNLSKKSILLYQSSLINNVWTTLPLFESSCLHSSQRSPVGQHHRHYLRFDLHKAGTMMKFGAYLVSMTFINFNVEYS